MPHECDKCGKGFSSKQGLMYHIEHNSCKEANFNCKHCDDSFTTSNSMYRHMKYSCKEKKNVDNAQEELLQRLALLEETNKRIVDENEKFKIQNKNLIDLTKKVTKIEKELKYGSSNVNVNNGAINNGNVTNHNNNITIVAYRHEDMSQLDSEDIIGALKTGFNSTKKLTEAMHFNPKYPQFSNIRRSNFNMKNKVMYYNGSNWITTSDPDMIDDLYNRKRDFIEENFDDYRDKLTKYDIIRLERWLKVNDGDQRIVRIKSDLREMLFNMKHISEANERDMANIESPFLICDSNEIDDFDSINVSPVIEKAEIIDNLESIITDIDDLDSITPDIKSTKPPKRIAPRNGRYRKVSARKAQK